MLRPAEVVSMAEDEDVDLIGINIGGRIEVVERILDALDAAGLSDIRVFAGGTIPPQAVPRLVSRGVSVHPPGSALRDIVAAAYSLTGLDEEHAIERGLKS